MRLFLEIDEEQHFIIITLMVYMAGEIVKLYYTHAN